MNQPKARGLRLCGLVVAACALWLGGVERAAAQLQPAAPEQHGPTQDVSRVQFVQDVARLKSFVAACKAVSGTCGVEVGPDDKVSAEGAAPAFIERWEWLREALKDAAKAKTEARANSMDQAAARLDELLRETGSATDAAAAAHRREEFTRTQKKAAEVLARSEFQNVRQPNWWDRLKARLLGWLFRIMMGVGTFGSSAKWLVTLLEWFCFTAAAAGLLLFLWRNFARQRLQIAMSAGTVQASVWDREATDWAAEADSRAAQHEWREAVHCLYWAAIVKLESRRAWRHDPARTPREYVRLLKAGSAQHGALRGLTGIFERVWYGLRDAEAKDYEQARTFFDGLGQGTVESAQ